MARYQVILAYDGTDFLGFQRQEPELRTVQRDIETALRCLGWQGQNDPGFRPNRYWSACFGASDCLRSGLEATPVEALERGIERQPARGYRREAG